jgi:hypothetical protein
VETTIAPGDSVPMAVLFTPEAIGRMDASVVIASDDPDTPEASVAVGGVALTTKLVDDIFVQDADPVDVLWVIDNSGSFLEEQARVQTSINAFFTYFETLNLDYHMGVITTDIVNPVLSGRLVGSPAYIDPTTPDGASTLATSIQVGSDDMGNESGLRASELALTEPLLSAENAGFYRPDARLSIIFMSDEPEQSDYDAQHYIDFFTALKPDPSRILISSIVGDYGTGCETTCDGAPSTAQPGDKYVDVTNTFGGVFGSICTCDLTTILDGIGVASTSFVRRFPLSQTPTDPATIVVTVDGEATTDWTYDADAQTVELGTAPANGSQIDIEYGVALTCDE